MDIAFIGEKDKFVVIYLDDITDLSKYDKELCCHLRNGFLKCRSFDLSIQALSILRSRKKVQSFLGKINFLRRFVSNFAEIVKLITTMLRKGNEVRWTPEA